MQVNFCCIALIYFNIKIRQSKTEKCVWFLYPKKQGLFKGGTLCNGNSK